MKKINILLTLATILFMNGCAPKVHENKVTLVEKKVITASNQTKNGKATGPIYLTHRQLMIEEISKFLEMDTETTLTHLKETNTHGYFQLIAKNYPPGMEFILYQIDLFGNVHTIKTYFVNGNGNLVAPLDDLFIEIENNYLFFSNYLAGEPVSFVLGSKDGQYYAATRIIPNPILAKDDLNRSISLELESPDKRHYRVKGSGLQPRKTYMLITAFENEKLMHAVETDEMGELVQFTGPTVPWVTGGDGSIELKGDGISSSLSTTFKWGL
jgi:hypothetical protein